MQRHVKVATSVPATPILCILYIVHDIIQFETVLMVVFLLLSGMKLRKVERSDEVKNRSMGMM